MTVTVRTQAELDAAIEAGEEHIIIDSPADAWLADIDPGPRKILAHRYPDVPKTR